MNLHQSTRPASWLDIYWDLRKRLIAAEFSAGDKLKPEELRERYGCAASTIREVLFRLSCDRLVSFQDQRGFRMPDISRDLLTELTALRSLVGAELRSAAHFQGTRELLTVTRGEARVESGDSRQSIGAGDSVHYRADVDHCIANTGSGELQAFMVVTCP